MKVARIEPRFSLVSLIYFGHFEYIMTRPERRSEGPTSGWHRPGPRILRRCHKLAHDDQGGTQPRMIIGTAAH